jgi:hypothetical protein
MPPMYMSFSSYVVQAEYEQILVALSGRYRTERLASRQAKRATVPTPEGHTDTLFK